MTYQVILVNNNNFKRITNIENVVDFNWQDDITKVFISFDFESTTKLECGNWIELFESDDNVTVFYGIITKVEQTKRDTYRYHGYDYGYYLEKNNIVLQLKKSSLLNSIRQACSRAEVVVGRIPEVNNVSITKIYKNETVTNILQDTYKKAVSGGLRDNFFYDCSLGRVELLDYRENNDLRGFIANLYSIRSLDNIKTFNRTTSIENLKNRVQVWSFEKNDKLNRLITRTDQESINRYGLLNHIEEVDTSKKNQSYEALAKSKLDELCKVSEEISFEVFGDYNMRKGTITTIRNRDINIDGAYKITSSKHNIKGTIETVTITVERFIS